MAWNIDPVHSQVTFSVKHMVVSTVKGNFKVFGGKIEINEANPQNSWVEANADTSSVDTRDVNRDNHLRSPDFFDAATYPEITFKSKNIQAAGDGEYRILGDLSLHGVTQEVAFQAEYAGQLKDVYGKQRAGLTAKATINRKDFGLGWNAVLETGGLAVSEKVGIEIELAAVKED